MLESVSRMEKRKSLGVICVEAAVERCYEVIAGWVDQCDVVTHSE